MSRRTGAFVGVILGLLLVAGWILSGYGHLHRRHAQAAQPAPLDADDIRELVGMLAKKQKRSFIPDMRVPAAQSLKSISLAEAQQYGALPALEKVAADKANPDAARAAQEALAKIRGQ